MTDISICRKAVIESFDLVIDQASRLNMAGLNLECAFQIKENLKKSNFTELWHTIAYIGDFLYYAIAHEMYNHGYSNEDIEKETKEWFSPLTPGIIKSISDNAFID